MAKEKINYGFILITIVAVVAIVAMVSLVFVFKEKEDTQAVLLVDEEGNVVGVSWEKKSSIAKLTCASYCRRAYTTPQECVDCCYEYGFKEKTVYNLCYDTTGK